MLSSEVSDNLVNGFPQLGGNPMVTGPARRYDVTISRLMPIYNGNGARQGAQQSLFVRRQVEKMIVQCPTSTSPLLVNELLNTNADRAEYKCMNKKKSLAGEHKQALKSDIRASFLYAGRLKLLRRRGDASRPKDAASLLG